MAYSDGWRIAWASESSGAPRVGIHTVFIGKENILFLKEWILYHKYMGVEHFFLYDNSGRRLRQLRERPILERRTEGPSSRAEQR